jgi:hypothetical protein
VQGSSRAAASARGPWTLLVDWCRTTDLGRTCLIQRPKEANGWTVFHLVTVHPPESSAFLVPRSSWRRSCCACPASGERTYTFQHSPEAVRRAAASPKTPSPLNRRETRATSGNRLLGEGGGPAVDARAAALEGGDRQAEVSIVVYADSDGSDEEAAQFEEGEQEHEASSSVGSSSSLWPVSGSRFWALVSVVSSDDEEAAEGEQDGSLPAGATCPPSASNNLAADAELNGVGMVLEMGSIESKKCVSGQSGAGNTASSSISHPKLMQRRASAGKPWKGPSICVPISQPKSLQRRVMAGKAWKGPLPPPRRCLQRSLGDIWITDRRKGGGGPRFRLAYWGDFLPPPSAVGSPASGKICFTTRSGFEFRTRRSSACSAAWAGAVGRVGPFRCVSGLSRTGESAHLPSSLGLARLLRRRPWQQDGGRARSSFRGEGMRPGGISREEVDGRSLRRRGRAVRADCTMAGKVRSGSVPEGVQKAGSGGSLEQAEEVSGAEAR